MEHNNKISYFSTILSNEIQFTIFEFILNDLVNDDYYYHPAFTKINEPVFYSNSKRNLIFHKIVNHKDKVYRRYYINDNYDRFSKIYNITINSILLTSKKFNLYFKQTFFTYFELNNFVNIYYIQTFWKLYFKCIVDKYVLIQDIFVDKNSFLKKLENIKEIQIFVRKLKINKKFLFILKKYNHKYWYKNYHINCYNKNWCKKYIQ